MESVIGGVYAACLKMSCGVSSGLKHALYGKSPLCNY